MVTKEKRQAFSG